MMRASGEVVDLSKLEVGDKLLVQNAVDASAQILRLRQLDNKRLFKLDFLSDRPSMIVNTHTCLPLIFTQSPREEANVVKLWSLELNLYKVEVVKINKVKAPVGSPNARSKFLDTQLERHQAE